MRLPKQDFYGQKERFEIALVIAPKILDALYMANKPFEETMTILPRDTAMLSKLIIAELNK
jgi:hypothetical protein